MLKDYPPLGGTRIAHMDKNGRVVVPKELRAKLGEHVDALIMWWDEKRRRLSFGRIGEISERGEAIVKRGKKKPPGRHAKTAR